MSNIDISINFSELDSILNPKMSISSAGGFISAEDYVYDQEIKACDAMIQKIACEDALLNFYRKVCQDLKVPDLLGKTIKVTPKQFNTVYETAKELSEIMNIALPDIFVYEDVYYRAEVEGVDCPWIEMSAKIIEDFSEAEMRFVLGKLFASIQCGHYKYEAISRALNEVTTYVDMIPVVNTVNAFHLMDGYKLNLMPAVNSWRRCCGYSTDACGLLISGSFKASIHAILKQILNSKALISEINISDYIDKAREIQQLSGKIIDYSKIDEAVPYGPYRVLELLRYASSERFSRALLEVGRR